MADKPLPQNRTRNRSLLLIFLGLIILAAGIYLYAGWLGYQEAPKLIAVQDPRSQTSDPYTLSPAQVNQINTHGYPDAFTILYYQEETPTEGIQAVRLETWDYYAQGIGLTFLNGELVSEDALEPGDLGALVPLPYRPEQFSAFMDLEQVLAAAGIESYIEIPLQTDFLSDGNLYYADSLSFGLQDDQLVYLEALALLED